MATNTSIGSGAQNSVDKLDRLTGMLRVDPTNKPLYRQCADLASALGRYETLAQLASDALARHPGDAAAIFDKSTALIAARDYRAALEFLATLDPVSARDTAVRSNQGLCLYQLGEYEQARPHLEDCYQQGVRSAGLLRLLVSTYHHLGLMDEAVSVAAENADAGSADAALAGVYALLYLDADEITHAARWAQTALNLNPKSIDGRVTQATLLTLRVETERARQMLESVVQDAPSVGRAWIGLGALALLAQDLKGAIGHLTRGLELMPGHVGSWHILGWAQLLSQDLSAAQRTFEHAMEMDRNFAESHGGLASIAAIRGERGRAEQLIQVALRLDADCLSARFAQSVLASGAGDVNQARKLLDSAVGRLAGEDSSALGKLLTKTTRQ